jgi:hypothetical protein
MSSRAISNFMRQQGFEDEPADACRTHFYGLYVQPRIVFPTVLLAIALQSGWLHLALSAVLWWNTLLPALNPFEVAYNHLIAGPRGQTPLPPAPGPRLMAQDGHTTLAWVAEAFLVVGFSALVFGKLCVGAYLFHLLKGRLAFANSTLPWGKG